MGIEDPTAPELAFCDRVREKLQATKDQISNEYVLRFTYLNSTLPEEDSAFATFCEGIQKDLDWRAKARPERLLEEYHSPRLHQLYKITFFGEDKTGHPIVYTCPGKMQPSALFGEFDSDDLDRWYISIMEYGRKLSEPAAGGNGKHMVIVLDLDGIGTAHADMRLINWIRGRSSFDVYHYPNAFVKIYVVNAGWAFTGVWTLIKPILPTSTVELVEILGGQSYYLPKLLERIDAANIPDFLGPVPVGGRSGLDDHLDHLCNCLSHHAFGGEGKDIFAKPTLFGVSDSDAPLGALSNGEKTAFKALDRVLPQPFKLLHEFPAGSAPRAGEEAKADAAPAVDPSAPPAN